MKESATRTRIIDVASRLFYEQGYNSTGINQIIDEAEIARASLYNHFSSKRDLLSAYIQRTEELWFEALDRFLAPIVHPKMKILGLFDFRIERQLNSGFGGCQFNKISAEVPKDDIEAFKMVSHQKDRLKIYIKELLLGIEFSSDQTLGQELLEENLFLLIEGATTMVSVYKNIQPLINARNVASKLLHL